MLPKCLVASHLLVDFFVDVKHAPNRVQSITTLHAPPRRLRYDMKFLKEFAVYSWVSSTLNTCHFIPGIEFSGHFLRPVYEPPGSVTSLCTGTGANFATIQPLPNKNAMPYSTHSYDERKAPCSMRNTSDTNASAATTVMILSGHAVRYLQQPTSITASAHTTAHHTIMSPSVHVR